MRKSVPMVQQDPSPSGQVYNFFTQSEHRLERALCSTLALIQFYPSSAKSTPRTRFETHHFLPQDV